MRHLGPTMPVALCPRPNDWPCVRHLGREPPAWWGLGGACTSPLAALRCPSRTRGDCLCCVAERHPCASSQLSGGFDREWGIWPVPHRHQAALDNQAARHWPSPHCSFELPVALISCTACMRPRSRGPVMQEEERSATFVR